MGHCWAPVPRTASLRNPQQPAGYALWHTKSLWQRGRPSPTYCIYVYICFYSHLQRPLHPTHLWPASPVHLSPLLHCCHCSCPVCQLFLSLTANSHAEGNRWELIWTICVVKCNGHISRVKTWLPCDTLNNLVRRFQKPEEEQYSVFLWLTSVFILTTKYFQSYGITHVLYTTDSVRDWKYFTKTNFAAIMLRKQLFMLKRFVSFSWCKLTPTHTSHVDEMSYLNYPQWLSTSHWIRANFHITPFMAYDFLCFIPLVGLYA